MIGARCAATQSVCSAASVLQSAPETGAGDLSIAQQQLVEIAKALAIDARILVMDEPTAALDRDDAARLLDLVKRLSEEGVSVIYVSHRMPEIKTVADRVTVLKDGRTVMTAPIAEAPTGRLVRAMVGRDLADFYPPRAAKPPGRSGARHKGRPPMII